MTSGLPIRDLLLNRKEWLKLGRKVKAQEIPFKVGKVKVAGGFITKFYYTFKQTREAD